MKGWTLKSKVDGWDWWPDYSPSKKLALRFCSGSYALRRCPMNECKLSEINWTKAADFCRGRPQSLPVRFWLFFVGVDEAHSWVLGGKTSSYISGWGFLILRLEKNVSWFKETCPALCPSSAREGWYRSGTNTLTILKKILRLRWPFWCPRWVVSSIHMLANVFLPSNPKLAAYMRQIEIEDGQKNLTSYCPEEYQSIRATFGLWLSCFLCPCGIASWLLSEPSRLTEGEFFL